MTAPRPHASAAVVRKTFHQFNSSVLAANEARFVTDVYVHSWNPEVADVVDGLYRPLCSLHELGMNSTSSARSQARSLARVIRLVRGHEDREPEFKHEMYLALRHDVYFLDALHYEFVPQAPLVFAQHCCAKRNEQQINIVDYCKVSRYIGKSARRSTTSDYNMYFMDWFFIARPSAIDSFAYIDARFDWYTRRIHALSINRQWTHFYWSYHTHFVLNATDTVRFHMIGGMNYSLTRHAPPPFAIGDRVAFPADPPGLFASGRRMCPHVGRVFARKKAPNLKKQSFTK